MKSNYNLVSAIVIIFILALVSIGFANNPDEINTKYSEKVKYRLQKSSNQYSKDLSSNESFSVEALKNSEWWPAIQKQVKAQEYHITYQKNSHLPDVQDAYQAPNRNQNLRTYFTSKGIKVINRAEIAPTWHAYLTLSGIGKKENILSLPEDEDPRVNGSRIEFHRGNVVEWYENRLDGLEQGFTISKKPKGRGPLQLFIDLKGNVKPVLSKDGQTVDFLSSANARVLRYGNLKAYDAKGKALSTHFELARNHLKIVVDDSDANYPIVVDPLLTTPAWTAEGDQAIARFGYAVSTAGDVNGDGYSDVIVGADQYDTGGNEGKVFVYFGSASGLSTTADWTAVGDQPPASYFGTSVDTAGDVNGDGYSDIIIAADFYDVSSVDTDDGKVFVYYGSASGPNNGVSGTPANADWTAESSQASSAFGWEVSTAGDVNGDGYSDIIIGAYYWDPPGPAPLDQGGVFVYHGSATGLDPDPGGDGQRPVGTPTNADWTAAGTLANEQFGNTVDSAGDVNGDGYDDVIVGAPGYSNTEAQEGSASVYYGSASGLSASADWTAESNQANAELGTSVRSAGDVNNDGFSDVIVGAYLYDNGQTNEGAAFVYHGSVSGLSSTSDWSAESNIAGAGFGAAVGTAGDVNGDGYSDVIVGAPGDGDTMTGWAYVYYGSASGLSTTADWTQAGANNGDDFGIAVSTAGDVNNDGYSDVIVGAETYDNGQTDEGAAYVYHGSAATNNPPSTPTVVSPADGTKYPAADPVTLSASAFSDPDTGNTHSSSSWDVRFAGSVYDRTDYDASFSSDDNTTDLTTQTVSGLAEGMKYVWRVRYKDSAGNLSPWSTESGFKIGTSVSESLPQVFSGTTISDFDMVSFVHWPDDEASTSVFNITYDTKYHRIGWYDTSAGRYIELTGSLKIVPGRAYWVLAREGLQVTYNGIPVSLTTDIDVSLSYTASSGNGWNMVACPNGANYLWENVQVVEYNSDGSIAFGPTAISALADPNAYIDKRLWRWDDGSYFSDTTLMEKYKGYWVKVKKANVYLRFPASAQANLSKQTPVYASLLIKGKRWMQKWIFAPTEAIAQSGDTPPPPMVALSDKNQGSVSCFIATAAYGSSMAPHVKVLREFRDRVLLANHVGKSFVDFYYKHSLPLADFISKHANLRTIVRLGLLPVVGASWLALEHGPMAIMAILMLLCSGFVGLLWTRLKKVDNNKNEHQNKI